MTSDALFGPRTARFFTDLARHNDRDWFTAHRQDYESAVREPLERLAAVAEPAWGPAKVFRPNRDVRFSADKSPYKANGSMWAGTVAGVYLQVDATGISAGGGLYEPTRDQRSRARAAIDERPAVGGALVRTMRRLEEDGFEFAGPGLTTAPRGYPVDHPRIAALRLQHYAALTRLPIDASIADIETAWKTVGPLVRWAAAHAGAAQEWP